VAQRRPDIRDIACEAESFHKVGSGGAGLLIIRCALDDLLPLLVLFIIVAFFNWGQDFLNLKHGIQRLRIL
jgi:hypothetical protein